MKAVKFKATALIFLATGSLFFGACRAKKPVPATPPAEVMQPETPPPPPPAAPKEEPMATTVPEKMPDFNYSDIQFEFNSSVLKTSSYAVLDQVSSEMKKYDTVKFNVEGHASREGTEQRNMTLSVDRANSVKSYLVNAGVDGSNLNTVGFGEMQPVASNDTEEGRVRNRRVEIKKMN